MASQEPLDRSALYLLADVACKQLESEKQLKLVLASKERGKRHAVTYLSGQTPLKKIKKESIKPIISNVGTDQNLMNEKKDMNDNSLNEEGLQQKIAAMKGSEAILVIEKTLTSSDVSSNLSRLSIPESQMNEFLSGEESDRLKMKVGKSMSGIQTWLHQSQSFNEVTVKRWEMAKPNGNVSIMYVLTTGWNKVVSQNKLKTGDKIQVWAFRVEQNLHLALHLLPAS